MFFLAVLLLLVVDEAMAMKRLKLNNQQCLKEILIKTTFNGNRVILSDVGCYNKSDFKSPENLLKTIQERIRKFFSATKKEDIVQKGHGEYNELFYKHHLNLLIVAFHRKDLNLFRALLQLPDITKKIASWEEIKRSETGEVDMQENMQGTIKEYIELHQQDAAGLNIPGLEEYWQLVQEEPQSINGSE